MIPSGLWLVSGARGAGKTRFCGVVVECARRSGWQVGGLHSPAVFNGERKTGILVESLVSREVRPLASIKAQSPFDLVLGDWHFDSRVLEWGNGELTRMLNATLQTPLVDLLVVDELGPLELLHGQGWTSALPLLNRRFHRVGLVVIRPELVETALHQLPALQGTITLTAAQDPEAEAHAWWKELIHA